MPVIGTVVCVGASSPITSHNLNCNLQVLSLDRKLRDTGAFFPGVAPNSTTLAEFSTMDTRNDTQEPVVSGTASTSEFEYAANTSIPSAEQPSQASKFSVHEYEASYGRFISATIRKSGSSWTLLVIWCACAVTLLQVEF